MLYRMTTPLPVSIELGEDERQPGRYQLRYAVVRPSERRQIELHRDGTRGHWIVATLGPEEPDPMHPFHVVPATLGDRILQRLVAERRAARETDAPGAARSLPRR